MSRLTAQPDGRLLNRNMAYERYRISLELIDAALLSTPRCRIAVAIVPRLFRQLVRHALGTIADLEVVGVSVNPIELAHLVDRADPDWLVVSLEADGRLPEMVKSLLARFPSLNVLGLSLDGSQVKIRRARQREEEAHVDITFEELIRTLHADPNCRSRRMR